MPILAATSKIARSVSVSAVVALYAHTGVYAAGNEMTKYWSCEEMWSKNESTTNEMEKYQVTGRLKSRTRQWSNEKDGRAAAFGERESWENITLDNDGFLRVDKIIFHSLGWKYVLTKNCRLISQWEFDQLEY